MFLMFMHVIFGHNHQGIYPSNTSQTSVNTILSIIYCNLYTYHKTSDIHILVAFCISVPGKLPNKLSLYQFKRVTDISFFQILQQ